MLGEVNLKGGFDIGDPPFVESTAELCKCVYSVGNGVLFPLCLLQITPAVVKIIYVYR